METQADGTVGSHAGEENTLRSFQGSGASFKKGGPGGLAVTRLRGSTAPPSGGMAVHAIPMAWKQRHLLSTLQPALLPMHSLLQVHSICWLKWGSTGPTEEGNSNPRQYSFLENPMDRGAWWATIHRVAKSWTRLSTHMCAGAIGPILVKWKKKVKIQYSVFTGIMGIKENGQQLFP